MNARVGVVVIGRNEGARLRRCLESLNGRQVVYVDSGSTDGSAGLARGMGVDVVMLDASKPFSAGRARNEGLARLRELNAGMEYVQFVDGDCEVIGGWIEAAAAFLEGDERCAVVAGRLRERHREQSIYNRLCDMEWDAPAGETKSCGGIAMYRVEAFGAAGGFDESVVAGEEPELCLRLRRAGWKVWRLGQAMAWHDAAMHRFGQWWRRAVRSGYAYALGARMHGAGAERHCVRETRSIWVWGLVVPAAAVGLAWWTWGLSMILLLGYGVLALRIWRRMRRRGVESRDAWLYARFCVLGKFAEAAGLCRHWVGRLAARPAEIIEYKQVRAAAEH